MDFTRDGFLRQIALALLSAITLTAGLTGSVLAQSWSPDGQKLAVSGSPLIQVDLGSLVPDAQPKAPPPTSASGAGIPGISSGIWPSWSPDGGKLAYLADGNKLTLLDLMSRQAIVPDAQAVSPIAWSPDSKFLAYVRTGDKGALELRTLHDNGDMALAVTLPFTKLASGATRTLAWVPTTDNVIVAGGDAARTDLYLIDQGEVVPLTTTGDVLGFAVSADGSRVRWVMRSRNTHYVLFLVYDLLIAKRTLTKLNFPERVPAVNPNPRRSVDAVLSAVLSPDLNQIAFIAQGGPGMAPDGTALYTVDVSGKHASLVGKGEAVSTPSPASKPPDAPADASQPPAPPALPNAVAPGAQPASTTHSEATGFTFPFYAPSFSPDSRQLAAVRKEGDRRYLMVYRIDNNGRRIALLP